MQRHTEDHSRPLRTAGERESRKKETQGRLIWFFICMLGAIIFSELLINSLINRLILPSLQAAFLTDGAWDTALTGTQLTILMGGLLLIFLLQAAAHLFPIPASAINFLQEWLNSRIQHAIPQMGNTSVIRNLTGWNGFSLVLTAFGLLLLELFPFILFGMLYIRFVIRQTEQVLREDETWYQELDKNRNLMLADIAHDIRNPMTTITGYAQALEDGMIRDPEKQKEYLAAIRRKSERVSSLIRVLFEYSRLNSTGFSLDRRSLDLCELLRENTAELYTDAEEKGLEIITEIPDAPFSVSADPVQLSRAVSNLISNAIRYNPAGTRILIALYTDKEGVGDTHIVIADTGEPIPDDTAARIFEPFSRGDASRPTDGGSGLGLSISESIVRMHGWELTLETSIPEYTKGFVIRIPW